MYVSTELVCLKLCQRVFWNQSTAQGRQYQVHENNIEHGKKNSRNKVNNELLFCFCLAQDIMMSQRQEESGSSGDKDHTSHEIHQSIFDTEDIFAQITVKQLDVKIVQCQDGSMFVCITSDVLCYIVYLLFLIILFSSPFLRF